MLTLYLLQKALVNDVEEVNIVCSKSGRSCGWIPVLEHKLC